MQGKESGHKGGGITLCIDLGPLTGQAKEKYIGIENTPYINQGPLSGTLLPRQFPLHPFHVAEILVILCPSMHLAHALQQGHLHRQLPVRSARALCTCHLFCAHPCYLGSLALPASQHVHSQPCFVFFLPRFFIFQVKGTHTSLSSC